MLTDNEKHKLLRELDAVEKAYDVVIPPPIQERNIPGYLITGEQRKVARYLESASLQYFYSWRNRN